MNCYSALDTKSFLGWLFWNVSIDKKSACVRILNPNQKNPDKKSTVVIRDISDQIWMIFLLCLPKQSDQACQVKVRGRDVGDIFSGDTSQPACTYLHYISVFSRLRPTETLFQETLHTQPCLLHQKPTMHPPSGQKREKTVLFSNFSHPDPFCERTEGLTLIRSWEYRRAPLYLIVPGHSGSRVFCYQALA